DRPGLGATDLTRIQRLHPLWETLDQAAAAQRVGDVALRRPELGAQQAAYRRVAVGDVGAVGVELADQRHDPRLGPALHQHLITQRSQGVVGWHRLDLSDELGNMCSYYRTT